MSKYLRARNVFRDTLRYTHYVLHPKKLLELERRTVRDHLTGVYSRAFFESVLPEAFTHADRTGERLSLLFLDLDNLKPINDTYGHEAGDEVLRYVGRALLTHSRAADIPFRYGGDEFGVLLPNTSREGAEIYKQHLDESELWTVQYSGRKIPVNLSPGIATFPDGLTRDITPEEFVRSADRAMYRAKSSKGTGRAFQTAKTV